MLTIKTKIKESPIAGIGLFADEFIPKGTVVWELLPDFDVFYTEEQVQQLPEIARQQFMNYCYHDRYSKNYVLCFDDARFFNHSDTPNTLNEEGTYGKVLASQDIHPGEELTTNYYEYEIDSKKEKGV